MFGQLHTRIENARIGHWISFENYCAAHELLDDAADTGSADDIAIIDILLIEARSTY